MYDPDYECGVIKTYFQYSGVRIPLKLVHVLQMLKNIVTFWNKVFIWFNPFSQSKENILKLAPPASPFPCAVFVLEFKSK